MSIFPLSVSSVKLGSNLITAAELVCSSKVLTLVPALAREVTNPLVKQARKIYLREHEWFFEKDIEKHLDPTPVP